MSENDWEAPQRPPKRGEFIPIEQIHEEHLHPGYDAGSLSPEELLEQKEEMEAEHRKKAEALNYGDVHDEDDADSGRFHVDHPVNMSAEDPRESDAKEPRVRVENGGADETDYSRAQGKHGKEPFYKNKKGQETVRKPNGDLQ